METKKAPITVRELALLALLGAMMTATQIAMAALPNVHLVGVLILLAVLVFGRRALFSVYVFVLLEGLIFGFGIWYISYLYVWAILALAALLMRRCRAWVLWAALCGGFGLCFGGLCALPYLFIGGWAAALSYWISGIPFDLIHAASNFVLTLVLLKPLYSITLKLAGPGYDT